MTRVLVSLLLAVLMAVGAAPAHADGDGVQVSLDGKKWSSSLPKPVFDPEARWVPGEDRVSELWVRNAGDLAASPFITIVSSDPDGLLASGLVTVTAGVGSSTRALSEPGRQYRLGDDSIAPGEAIRIELTAAFAAEAGNSTMRQAVPLDFSIRLTGAAAPPSAGTPGGGTPKTPQGTTPEGLPNTGAPELMLPLVASTVLIGLGCAFIVAARRRREDEEEVQHVVA